jgi:hypothetical protein
MFQYFRKKQEVSMPMLVAAEAKNNNLAMQNNKNSNILVLQRFIFGQTSTYESGFNFTTIYWLDVVLLLHIWNDLDIVCRYTQLKMRH